MTKQQEQIVKLAEKGGKNAELFLLDLIHELENKIKQWQTYN